MIELPFRLARVAIDATGGISDDETRTAATLGSERRRREFIAGRLAARAALGALVGRLPEELVIARGGDGAPEIRGLSPAPSLSISHGRRAAVASAGWLAALGVDLADHDDEARIRRVAARWIRDDERALAARIDTALAWSTLWALKEAAAKALRQGLLDGGLRAARLVALEPPRFDEAGLRAHVIPSADDVVAVVWSIGVLGARNQALAGPKE